MISLTLCIHQGHKRHALKGRDYPAVVYTGNDKDEITGILVQGLHTLDVKRLDAFEGPVSGKPRSTLSEYPYLCINRNTSEALCR